MRFSWDESKRSSNLQKHHLDFADAEIVFDGVTLTFEDTRFEYGEQRFITIGLLAGVCVVIAHADKTDEIRVISMRKATKYEQKIFVERFGN